jgi:hypothetical protein
LRREHSQQLFTHTKQRRANFYLHEIFCDGHLVFGGIYRFDDYPDIFTLSFEDMGICQYVKLLKTNYFITMERRGAPEDWVLLLI